MHIGEHLKTSQEDTDDMPQVIYICFIFDFFRYKNYLILLN